MDRLLDLLRTHSYREGRVKLTSGRESDFFVDCKQTALLAEGHALVGERMGEAVGRFEGPIHAVAGVELGGCSLASAVAMHSFAQGRPKDAVYVRKQAKEHGSRRLVEGSSHLPAQARVVVLEDVVTTGGSTVRAIETLREAGLEVVGVVALVDREEGGASTIEAAGVPFVALYRRADFLGSAA